MLNTTTSKDITSAAYLALRLAPGTLVDYRGTQATEHGTYTVQPCSCPHCTLRVLTGRPANRYELNTPDGKPAGPIHVRHTSVVPLAGDDELMEAAQWVPTTKAALHLRRMLRRAFPGQTFSVRTGRRSTKGNSLSHAEITVTWTGGPTRTAVATVTAPLLATYGTRERCRPAWITVPSQGRVYRGLPNVHAVHLDRR